MRIHTSNIFEVAESSDKVVCPPAQVFKNENMDFLLTIGGHIVEDKSEYQRLMNLLIEIGEENFLIRENLGATITDRTVPFEATFSVDSTLDEFNNKIKEFDEHFSLTPWHWFVNGQKMTWGIYISEYPTVNIIGCDQSLTKMFRSVFNIIGNGYEKENEFLNQEFNVAKDATLKRQFFDNYKIEKTP